MTMTKPQIMCSFLPLFWAWLSSIEIGCDGLGTLDASPIQPLSGGWELIILQPVYSLEIHGTPNKPMCIYIYIRNSQHYYFIHMIIHICWLCWLCWCWFACLSLISPGHFHDIENERKLDENDELCPGLPLVARGLSASIRAKMECWIGRRWSKSSKRWDICCFAASLKQG